MKLIPYKSVIFQSPHIPEEILRRIEKRVEPWFIGSYLFHFYTTRKLKPYHGLIKENEFKLNRIRKERFGFRPRIIGEVYTTATGSEIKIRFRLSLSGSFVNLILWYSLSHFGILILPFNSQVHTFLIVAVPTILFFIIYLIILVRFNSEVNLSIEHFSKLFK